MSTHAMTRRRPLLGRLHWRRAEPVFRGDPAGDGRDAADVASPFELRPAESLDGMAFYPAPTAQREPVAAKDRPGTGAWTTVVFPAFRENAPAADVQPRRREPAALPVVHHEQQSPEILRRVLAALRSIGTDPDPATGRDPATDLDGQGIFASLLMERMRHPGAPAGTRCAGCGYRAEGFSDERRQADLTGHVIREVYGREPQAAPDDWLDSWFADAMGAIRVQARAALDDLWAPLLNTTPAELGVAA